MAVTDPLKMKVIPPLACPRYSSAVCLTDPRRTFRPSFVHKCTERARGGTEKGETERAIPLRSLLSNELGREPFEFGNLLRRMFGTRRNAVQSRKTNASEMLKAVGKKE